MIRATARRAAIAAVAALIAGLNAQTAIADNRTVTLGHDSSPAYGVKTFSFDVDVHTDIISDGTLFVTVIGDLDDPDETISLSLDGYSLGQIYAGSGGGKCVLTNFTVTIPQSTMKTKAADGRIDFDFTTSAQVSSAKIGATECDYNGETNISAYVGAVLTYQTSSKSEGEVLEDTISTSESLGYSRRTVTMANLPRLSRRLGRVSFNRTSPGGALPRPTAPSSTPSPITSPTGGQIGGGGQTGGSAPVRGAGQAGWASSPGMLSGSGGSDRGYVSVAGDLHSLRQAVASLSDSEGGAASFGVNDASAPVDVWFGGSYTYFETSAAGVSQTGDIATAQIGLDTRLSERLLVGVAAFGDFLLSDVSNSTETEGLGFMTGPYFVASLDGPVYLEGLAAVGRAYNLIRSDGAPDARYESDRLLLTVRLSGDWSAGAWSFRPSTRLTYYAEKQESFRDGAGSLIPSATSVLGQLRFGPEIGYSVELEDASARPFIGIEGAWSFQQSDRVVDGVVSAAEDLSGGLAVGLDGRWGRATFRAGGRYEGFGDQSTDSYGGELTVRMPFD